MSCLNDMSVENDVAALETGSNLDDISNAQHDYRAVQHAVHCLSPLFLHSRS